MNILDEFKNLFRRLEDGYFRVNISEILIALVIFLFFLFCEEYCKICNQRDWKNTFPGPQINLTIL